MSDFMAALYASGNVELIEAVAAMSDVEKAEAVRLFDDRESIIRQIEESE